MAASQQCNIHTCVLYNNPAQPATNKQQASWHSYTCTFCSQKLTFTSSWKLDPSNSFTVHCWVPLPPDPRDVPDEFRLITLHLLFINTAKLDSNSQQKTVMSWRNVFGDLLAVGGAKTAKFDNDPVVVVLVQKLVIISQCRLQNLYCGCHKSSVHSQYPSAAITRRPARATGYYFGGKSKVAIAGYKSGTVETRRNKNQL